MVLKIFAPQIPNYWEAIKHAAVTTEGVAEKDQQRYINDLFFNLLSGIYNCVIYFSEDDGQIDHLLIYYMEFNEITQKKYFVVKCLFGFRKTSLDRWKEDYKQTLVLAKHLGCDVFCGNVANENLAKIADELGSVKKRVYYETDL